VSSKPRVVIPADTPPQIADSPRLDCLRPRVTLRVYSDFPASAAEQVARVREAEILINSRGRLTWSGELLDQLPNLRMITTCSIGVDSIDVAAAARRGIVVSNVPGRTAEVVAEHALALMLAVARRVAHTTTELKAGHWRGGSNTLLRGKLLGVAGTGSIGREMIRLGQAIGMRVQAWTFHPSAERAAQLGVPFVGLEELLATSDAVSLHVKLTNDSFHLLSERELRLMKPGSFLVNTARGAIVDTDALVEALRSGHLGGAALDVFESEPLPADHPLLGCEQVVLTPHSADQNPEGIDLLNAGAVENVLAFLDGKPQNVVT
jgi:D-3-phosphoglycerate dehydrogenase